MKLYKVEFTFNDSYTIKGECWRQVSLVVLAEDKFDALRVAWTRVSGLELPEPSSFSASIVSKD